MRHPSGPTGNHHTQTHATQTSHDFLRRRRTAFNYR
jgi:hypothetical protein